MLLLVSIIGLIRGLMNVFLLMMKVYECSTPITYPDIFKILSTFSFLLSVCIFTNQLCKCKVIVSVKK